MFDLLILSGAAPCNERGPGQGVRGGRRLEEEVLRRDPQQVGRLAEVGLEPLRLSGLGVRCLLLDNCSRPFLFSVTVFL